MNELDSYVYFYIADFVNRFMRLLSSNIVNEEGEWKKRSKKKIAETKQRNERKH